MEAVSPELGNRVQRVRVQLPGTSSDLLNKFREKRVDFASHTNTEDGGAVFLNLLGEQSVALSTVCKHVILEVDVFASHCRHASLRFVGSTAHL